MIGQSFCVLPSVSIPRSTQFSVLLILHKRCGSCLLDKIKYLISIVDITVDLHVWKREPGLLVSVSDSEILDANLKQ